MIELHIYSILAILEVLLLVSVLSGYLYVRNRRHTRTIARLSQPLPQTPAAPTVPVAEPAPAPAPEDRSEIRVYSDFLREELEASSLMLGSGTVSEAAGETDPGPETESQQGQVREMLAARHQFLQLELDAQALHSDPEARRQHIVQQMQNLFATFTPVAAAPAPAAEDGAGEEAGTLAREQQLESQLAHLRTVVGNQQDVMRELRGLLEQEMGESEELRGIIAKLQDAEARSLELERSLEAMDSRTPAPGEPGQGGAGSQGAHVSPDSDMLRDLVGSQQQTISKLQHMLKQSVGEKEASVELRDAMEKIQRSNQELGTCVMVLEDENSLLREQLDSLRSQLEDDPDDEAAHSDADSPAAPGTGPESTSDPSGLDEVLPDPQPEAVTAPEPEVEVEVEVEAELEPEPAEEEIEAASRAGETVEDIDALLEDPGASGPDTETAVAEAEGDAEDARQEAGAHASPADSDTGGDAGETDDGINTLQDVGLDNDDEDVLSDEDIDALLAGEKKT